MRPLTPNAVRVLDARYLLRDSSGAVREDWAGLCDRVADAVSQAETHHGGEAGPWRERFGEMLRERTFLPNSPTLMNAGTPDGQLSACFVLPVEDTLEGVFNALHRMAAIHQSGGGTGFSFSRLRPAGDPVQNTPGVASGPVAFMDVFDAATAVVKQGGRRRGANMGVLRVDHPDVLDFIRAKADPERLTNFNLSLAVTDAFWAAASAGGTLDLLHPGHGGTVGSVDASKLLDEIAHQAWTSGDPGVICIDAVNRENPTPALGAIEATNPCGELPLLPNEACNLGSLRLDAFLRDGAIDWECLDRAVESAVRFLDDVIDISHYPFPEIDACVRGNRKIGLGVMGFADLLVALGIPYDDEAAVGLAEQLMGRIRERAERASAELAEQRGVFPNWAGSTVAARGRRLRNATVLSVAPTGTLSILAGCAGGIEPFFALAFVRHVLDGERLPETQPLFEDALRRAGAWSEDLVAEVRETGAARHIQAVPEAVRRLFPTALDIAPARHLAIQAAFQRHVDNAVSKTINLPADTTVQQVREIYLAAWRLGLKGITVFREGCKENAVLVRGAAGAEVPDDFAGDCSDALCG